jgi:hypothetical protein
MVNSYNPFFFVQPQLEDVYRRIRKAERTAVISPIIAEWEQPGIDELEEIAYYRLYARHVYRETQPVILC